MVTAEPRGVSDPPRGDASTSAHHGAIRDVARNGLWGGLGAVVASLMGFGLTLAVAHAVGPAGSGTFFAAVALAMVLITVGVAGADTALLWALPRERAGSDGAKQRWLVVAGVVPVAVVSLLLAIAVWASAPSLATRIASGDVSATVDLLRTMSIGVAVGPVLQCLVQATRGTGDVLPFMWIQQIGVPTLRVLGVVAIVLVMESSSVAELGLTWVAPLVLLTPLAAATLRRRTPHAPWPDADERRSSARALWRFSLRSGLGSTCALSLKWADVLLVAVLASPAQAGVYAAASRFATSGQLGLQAIRLGVGPQVAAAFATGNSDRVRILYNVTTQWSVALSWPIFTTLALFPDVVLSWFGAGFDEGSVPLIILSLAMMFSVAAGNVGTLLLMSGNAGWSARNTAAALVTNLALNVFLIPWLGGTGAACAWAASIVVENGLGLYFVNKRLGFNGHSRPFWIVAGVVLAVMGISGLVSTVALGRTNVALLVHLLLSGACLAVLGFRARNFLHIDLLLKRPARAAEGTP